MSDFLKKALGMFVEFDETPDQPEKKDAGSPQRPPALKTPSNPGSTDTLNAQEIEKFSKHFDELFEKSNFPGPDYYEFSKMMNLLETPIPDEHTRISAVFASLSIQGLTKDRILESARQYADIITGDKQAFEKAANDKAATEIDGRKASITELEEKIAANSEQIRKLTQQITEAQGHISTLQNELLQQENKLTVAKSGYNIACQALINKINTDIQKINTTLK